MSRRSPLARAPHPDTRPRRTVEFSDTVQAVPGPIVVATDASVGKDRVAIGFLSTTGHTGLRAHPYPAHLCHPHTRVVATELRAVYWGLQPVLTAHPGRPIEVRVDSLQALDHLRAWQAGSTRMPKGYDTRLRPQGQAPTLARLQMLIEYTPGLAFVHEKAHVGNPLNEAADSLAKLGLRTVNGKVLVDEIPGLVPLWAARALDEHRRTVA
ncbi:hypothetical protein [Streptomyces sp. NPDC002758]